MFKHRRRPQYKTRSLITNKYDQHQFTCLSLVGFSPSKIVLFFLLAIQKRLTYIRKPKIAYSQVVKTQRLHGRVLGSVGLQVEQETKLTSLPDDDENTTARWALPSEMTLMKSQLGRVVAFIPEGMRPTSAQPGCQDSNTKCSNRSQTQSVKRYLHVQKTSLQNITFRHEWADLVLLFKSGFICSLT